VRTVLVVKGGQGPPPTIHNFSKQNQFEGSVIKNVEKDKTKIEWRHHEGKERDRERRRRFF
jgi:hypothetical protein